MIERRDLHIFLKKKREACIFFLKQKACLFLGEHNEQPLLAALPPPSPGPAVFPPGLKG